MSFNQYRVLDRQEEQPFLVASASTRAGHVDAVTPHTGLNGRHLAVPHHRAVPNYFPLPPLPPPGVPAHNLGAPHNHVPNLFTFMNAQNAQNAQNAGAAAAVQLNGALPNGGFGHGALHANHVQAFNTLANPHLGPPAGFANQIAPVGPFLAALNAGGNGSYPAPQNAGSSRMSSSSTGSGSFPPRSFTHHRRNRLANPFMSAPPAPSLAPTTFHPFSRLPKELQVKIWKASIPGPRLIELSTREIVTTIDEGCIVTHTVCVAQSDHPVHLHVNRDSRAIALKSYQLAFGDEFLWPVYFDFKRDALLAAEIGTLDVLLTSSDSKKDFGNGGLQLPFVVLDPKRVLTSTTRPTRESFEPFRSFLPASELASAYDHIGEVVILRYPSSHPLGALPMGLHQATPLRGGLDSVTGPTQHYFRSLSRWVQIQTNPGNPPQRWDPPKVVAASVEEVFERLKERAPHPSDEKPTPQPNS